MSVPSFVTPLNFENDIRSVKQSETGLTIEYDDRQSIDVYCDILTASYYESKLQYELMYKKSVNQEILDYLMTHIKTKVNSFRCEYDNINKFVVTVEGISIKCEEVNKEFNDEIKVLVDYLRIMDSLKDIEEFIESCDSEPLLIENRLGSTLKNGDQELELTTEAIQYVMTIIRNNLPRKRKQRWYRNLFFLMSVLVVLVMMSFTIHK
jgi:hypothetical protein